jgi:hypothetical protein
VKLGNGSLCRRRMGSLTSALLRLILAAKGASVVAQSCLHSLILAVSRMVVLGATLRMSPMSALLLLRQHRTGSQGLVSIAHMDAKLCRH